MKLLLEVEEQPDGTYFAQVGRENNAQLEWPMELTGYSDASLLLEEVMSLADAMLLRWLLEVEMTTPRGGATG